MMTYRALLSSALLSFSIILTACSEQFEAAVPPKLENHADIQKAPNALPFMPLPEHTDIDNPRIHLGKRLFHDTRLSADNTISCASCHNIQAGGDDNLKTSRGINGAVGPINTPTVLNSAFNIAQFWDGRVPTLKEQVSHPIHNPIEMGSNWAEVLDKLLQDQNLNSQFQSTYPDGLTITNISDAIAAYQSALVTSNSRFDQYLRGHTSALSIKEKEGFELFMTLGCSSCHQGKNIGGNMYQQFGVIGSYFDKRGGDVTKADLGRYNVTGREQDKFVFRVPSLRNIEKTAPYFHDGSAESLEAAVAVMAEYQLGLPISEDQITTIVAFLHTLNGEVDQQLQ